MANKPLTDAFIAAMERELGPLGYAYRPDADWLSRFDGHFEFLLALADDETRGGLRIAPSVGIRVGPIEAFFHRTSAYGANGARTTSVAGLAFTKLAKLRSDFVWLIHDARGQKRVGRELTMWRTPGAGSGETSLKQAVKEIVKMFLKMAVPFFERYGNLEALDQAINTRPDSFDYPLGGMPINRASYGLILAKLLGRKDFDHLCEVYDQQLAKVSNGFYLKWFRPLVKDLRENGELLLKMWNSAPGQGGPVIKPESEVL